MSEEPELHAEAWYRIKAGMNRGFLAAIKERYPDTLDEPNDYRGTIVKIDGERFLCKGAETFAINRSKNDPYKLQFALLVKEIDPEKPQKSEKSKEKDLLPDSVKGNDYGRPMDIAPAPPPAPPMKPPKPEKSETVETEDWVATFTDD
jgi:hypothetical protein